MIAGEVAVVYLVLMSGLNKSLAIPLSFIVGMFGFFLTIYWIVKYLTKSSYTEPR